MPLQVSRHSIIMLQSVIVFVPDVKKMWQIGNSVIIDKMAKHSIIAISPLFTLRVERTIIGSKVVLLRETSKFPQ